jgi:hypothetical protein
MISTSFHEAGHAVFANIFKDYIHIQEVSILPGEYGKGGVRIGTIKPESSETPLDRFHFVVVNLAGLVVQFTTDDRGNNKVFHKILSYLKRRLTPNDSTTDSFDGDYENMQNALTILSKELKKTKEMILIIATLFIARLLQREDIWMTIDTVALELENSKTINTLELTQLFNSIGFNQFIINNKAAFVEESKSLLFDN